MQHGLFILQCTHRQAHTHSHTHTLSCTVTELNIGVKSWLTIYAPPLSVFAQFAFCNIYCKLVFASQYRNSSSYSLHRSPTFPTIYTEFMKICVLIELVCEKQQQFLAQMQLRLISFALFKLSERNRIVQMHNALSPLLFVPTLSLSLSVLVSILFLSISAHCTAIKIDLCRRD